jgi:enoyl-CoA hydratase
MSENRSQRVIVKPGAVTRVTVDNQAKLNTLDSALMEELAEAIENLAKDDALRVVILTGAGERAFVGGASIDEMAELNPATAEAFITRLQRCCSAIRDLPVPVIARIRGYALGAGLELAAACDLRIAEEGAVFGMPEVKIGLPSVIEAALLPGMVGWGRARQILLLGENFSARDAEAWGLVEKVVPAGDLDAAVEQWVESILAAGPRAVRLQKELMRAWENLPLREAIEAGIPALSAAFETDEPTLRMRAFQASRARRSE